MQMPVAGLFSLETSRIIRGALAFGYDPRSSRTPESSTQQTAFLRISEDPYAFNAKLHVPNNSELD
jgi:hypothetical protein